MTRRLAAASAAPPTDGSAAFCLFMLATQKKLTMDEARAKNLLQTAVDHGDLDAMAMALLGAGLSDKPKDMQYILELGQRAALGGSVLSATLLGSLLEDVDPAQARAWYQRSIDAGDVDAMRKLSAIYRAGRGVAQDDRRATELIAQAAGEGDHNSMVELALNYDTGTGVTKDHDTAVAFMRKALLLENADPPGPARQWLQEHGENP